MPALEIIVADAQGQELSGAPTGSCRPRYSVMQGYLDDPGDDSGDRPAGFLQWRPGTDGRARLRASSDARRTCLSRLPTYPAEVENTLLGHDAIAQVAVIGVPTSAWARWRWLTSSRPGTVGDPAAIIAGARARPPTTRCCGIVVGLPTNATGILKDDLRTRRPAGPGRLRIARTFIDITDA
jgi:hypothetical protein